MPPQNRLRRSDFPAGKPSKRLQGALFSLSVSPLAAGVARVSFVVPKKVVPMAHERNQLKRHCREAGREEVPMLNKPLALVFTAKRAARGASSGAIREDIIHLLQSLK